MDAMASEVSTAGAQQDLRRRLAELERELGEAHQREAATAEPLQVINRPQLALQSVFDAIAQSAGRLCEAEFASVFRLDGEFIGAAALYGVNSEGVAAWRKAYPRPAGEDTSIGRAILRRAVVQIPDVQADPTYGLPALAQIVTYRSVMAVPFLRDGHPIGGIAVGRAQACPFPEGQIRLLRSFADQAVIAIENTRLFEAEQASKRDLSAALEQQTATADVLKVISRSALDLQKILDALVESAARLCNAHDALIFQLFGDGLRLVAHHGQIPTARPVGQLTRPLVRGFIIGRAVIDGRTIQVADALAEADEYPESHKNALQLGYRTQLAVPLLHAGEAIGAILIRRGEVRRFTERQIELVNTFADQAVIAIENTRLFEQVQARTHDLQESLDYQTATSDVLGVISRSPNQLQPVLDAIVETAFGLCPSNGATIMLREADLYRRVASAGYPPEENTDRR